MSNTEFNYADIIDKLNDISESFNNVNELDKEGLEHIYDNILALESIIEELSDNEFVNMMFSMVSSMMGIDCKKEISKWKTYVEESLKKYNEAKCDCCECNDCDDECDCDYCDCEFEPITYNYVKDCLGNYLDKFGNTKKENDTYINLIASYINEECPYLTCTCEEILEERDNLIWSLYDFINFTMNR